MGNNGTKRSEGMGIEEEKRQNRAARRKERTKET
jgi:hypothetical protein